MNTKMKRKTVKKYLVIYCVESSGQVKENESRDFLLIYREEKIIVNTEQSSFGRIKFTISRLKRAERREGLKMIRETRMNYAFKNFGYEIQIRNGTITGQVLMGLRMFLKKICNNGRFETIREGAFG